MNWAKTFLAKINPAFNNIETSGTQVSQAPEQARGTWPVTPNSIRAILQYYFNHDNIASGT